MPKRSHTIIFLAICALTVVGVVFALNRMSGVTGLEQTEAGAHLGWVEVEDPVAIDDLTELTPINADGAPDLSGAVLVNIWASWCDPCEEELPWLRELNAEGVPLIGIARDGKAKPAAAMIKKFDIAYPNYLDADSVLHEALGGKLPLQGIPTTLLVEDGRVMWVHVGVFKSYKDLHQGVSERLGAPR